MFKKLTFILFLAFCSESCLQSQTIHVTPSVPLDQAIAATPAGGSLYIGPGAYAISSTITRTFTIHIICDAASTITSDAQPTILISGHSADGSSIVGCNFASAHTWQLCSAPPLAPFDDTICNQPYVTIKRVTSDSLGYQPTANDSDVLPYLSPTQLANIASNPLVVFTDVSHIHFLNNTGYRFRVQVTYTDSGSHNVFAGDVEIGNNDIVCGSYGFGCIYVGGDLSTFTPANNDAIIAARVIHNHLSHNAGSGSITIYNTTGADVGDNSTSYSGEVEIKTEYNPQSLTRNFSYNIHDNHFSHGMGGCADLLESDGITDEPTYGKFVGNYCEYNGLGITNGGGLTDSGSYDLIANNVFQFNACIGASIQGDHQTFIGNVLTSNGQDPNCPTYSSNIDFYVTTSSTTVPLGGNIVVANNRFNSITGYRSLFGGGSVAPLYLYNNVATGGTFYFGAGLTPTVETGDSDANGARPNQFATSGTFTAVQAASYISTTQPVMSITPQAAAGAGATASCADVCTASGGEIAVTTGTGATTGLQVLITFATVQPHETHCVYQSEAGASNPLDGYGLQNYGGSTNITGWGFATLPPPSGTYYMTYVCF